MRPSKFDYSDGCKSRSCKVGQPPDSKQRAEIKNAGYLVNPTREFVVPGGKAVPEGSMLFELGSDGDWIPIRKF